MTRRPSNDLSGAIAATIALTAAFMTTAAAARVLAPASGSGTRRAPAGV
jgi:hypothetical protein